MEFTNAYWFRFTKKLEVFDVGRFLLQTVRQKWDEMKVIFEIKNSIITKIVQGFSTQNCYLSSSHVF